MYFYNNHRFYFHDFSFELPNNTYLMCGEEILLDTIQFSPQGKNWDIILFAANNDGGAKQFFYTEEEKKCYH